MGTVFVKCILVFSCVCLTCMHSLAGSFCICFLPVLLHKSLTDLHSSALHCEGGLHPDWLLRAQPPKQLPSSQVPPPLLPLPATPPLLRMQPVPAPLTGKQ